MSESAFRSGVRSAVRGLWSGALSRSQFNSALSSAISRHLQTAWTEGAAECSVKADELTEEETKALAEFIAGQIDFISGFADAIREHDKTSKGKLQPLFDRADMWVNRYSQARQQASSMACGNLKKVWTLGATEHCPSCVRLNGKVKRNSYWQQKGILPRVAGASYLKCGGYRCKCSLETTDRPISKGNLPSLP